MMCPEREDHQRFAAASPREGCPPDTCDITSHPRLARRNVLGRVLDSLAVAPDNMRLAVEPMLCRPDHLSCP